MPRLLLSSLLVVLGVGCAGASNTLRTSPAVPMSQRSGEPMLVTETSITGPSSSLKLGADGMRGRFRDLPVSLHWDYQRVTGIAAALPTRLELSEGDDTRILGSFGGTAVALLLKDEWLVGRVGACSYVMRRMAGGYSGKRDCAGPLEEQFVVDFPENLQERPLGQMATLLTLTLINYTATYSPAISPARFTRPRESGRHTSAKN